MPYQHRRAVLQRQGALRRGHAPFQRRQRVLHRGDVEPRRLQPRDDLGPARAVGEQPVHQHDVAGFRRGRCRGGAIEQQARGAGGRQNAHDRATMHQRSPFSDRGQNTMASEASKLSAPTCAGCGRRPARRAPALPSPTRRDPSGIGFATVPDPLLRERGKNMLPRVRLRLRSVAYALRGGFLVRPLVIAVAARPVRRRAVLDRGGHAGRCPPGCPRRCSPRTRTRRSRR